MRKPPEEMVIPGECEGSTITNRRRSTFDKEYAGSVETDKQKPLYNMVTSVWIIQQNKIPPIL